MPRGAREKSQSGIYHIIVRGINRQSIFEDDEDRQKLLQTLLVYKEQCGYSIYAYCFMGNHVHLLLKVGKEPLEQIMRRIGGSYVYWYNHKYDRIGNLFQDRFKSEPVETDAYFLTVLRYIHQNPMKAGIEGDISNYEWSSYSEYVNDRRLIDREEVLGLLSGNHDKAIREFIKFMDEPNSSQCLDVKEKKNRITDNEAKRMIEEILKIKPAMIRNEPIEKKEEILKEILRIEGISTRQLARITGVSANLVWRVSKEGGNNHE
jgi:REP element-mobilizing transposase RayT